MKKAENTLLARALSTSIDLTREVRRQGYEAEDRGQGIYANPYTLTFLKVAWREGWLQSARARRPATS